MPYQQKKHCIGDRNGKTLMWEDCRTSVCPEKSYHVSALRLYTVRRWLITQKSVKKLNDVLIEDIENFNTTHSIEEIASLEEAVKEGMRKARHLPESVDPTVRLTAQEVSKYFDINIPEETRLYAREHVYTEIPDNIVGKLINIKVNNLLKALKKYQQNNPTADLKYEVLVKDDVPMPTVTQGLFGRPENETKPGKVVDIHSFSLSKKATAKQIAELNDLYSKILKDMNVKLFN